MITRIRKVEPNNTESLETQLTANGIEVVQKEKRQVGRPKIKLEGFSQKVILGTGSGSENHADIPQL